MRNHTHPVMIAEALWRFVYLLLIPAARGLFMGLQYGFSGWLSGAWFDALVLAIMVGLATLHWRCITYQRYPSGFSLVQGVLHRRTLFIPNEQMDTMALTRPFYLKPFGAVRVRIDTKAGRSDRADIKLSLSRPAAEQLLDCRQLHFHRDGWLLREYRPRGVHVAALCAILSNSLAGVLFFSTFISQTGRLLGGEFENRIFGTFETFTRMMAFGLPPAAAAIAYLMLFGWLFTFLRNLIRHKNFCARRNAKTLEITGGILTNRIYSVLTSAINYVDIRQSTLTKLLGLHSVFIHAVGYGKEDDDVSALIPASDHSSLLYHLNLLLPELKPAPRQLKPNFGAIFRFLNDAFWPCLLLPLVTWLMRRVFPDWSEFILWLGFMSCLPAYLFFTVRVLDFTSSGVACHGETYTLRYSRGFYLHTVILPRTRIASVTLRQSIFQKMDGKCDVFIYSFSEKRCRHRLRNLNRAKAAALFGLETA